MFYFTQSLQTEGDCTWKWAAVATFHTLPNSLFIKCGTFRRCIEQLKALSVRGFVIASWLLVRTYFCLWTCRTPVLCCILQNDFPSVFFWPQGNVTSVGHIIACIRTHGIQKLEKITYEKTYACLYPQRDLRPALRLVQHLRIVGPCLRQCLLRNGCRRRRVLYVFIPRTLKARRVYRANYAELVGQSHLTLWCRYVGV